MSVAWLEQVGKFADPTNKRDAQQFANTRARIDEELGLSAKLEGEPTADEYERVLRTSMTPGQMVEYFAFSRVPAPRSAGSRRIVYD